MSEQDQQLEEVAVSIEDAKKKIALKTSLQKLENNEHFKKVILEGYLDTYAVRLVKLKADPSMQHPDKQADILKQIDAIGNLNNYFRYIGAEGNLAEKAIEDYEVEREAILAENEEAK